jgi:radical SAM protein with 4Fe4S-binding SPASM domain
MKKEYGFVKRGTMSQETLINVLDKVPFTKCSYHNWGEPLLHPDIVGLVEEGKSRGKTIEMHTNMQKMTPEVAEGFVKAKMDIISVSCDGITQEVYEKYRVGGKLDKVVAGARLLADTKKKFNSKFPNIKWQMVVNKYNQHQADQFKQFAMSYGANSAACNDMYSQTPQGWFRIKDYATTDKRWKAVRVIGTVKTCNEPNHRFAVDWNGDAYLCCNTVGIEQYKMGNINEQSFEEIWYGEKYEYSRRFCKTGKPEDNGFVTQCHACFNKFPNEKMRRESMWAPCLDAIDKEKK